MDTDEYNKKYVNLRILKSIQEYLKPDSKASTAIYPITVPNDLLYQVTKLQGPVSADKLIHHIFQIGLNLWSEKVYNDVFGSEEDLEEFIKMVKNRSNK